MSIPSQREYEQRELQLAYQRIEDVKNAPLADRKEAQGEFFEYMRDRPDIVADRVGWLLDGSYGYGERLQAMRILHSPRMNREAQLLYLIGIYEWMVPTNMTIAAWKNLTPAQKNKLDKLVKDEIRTAEESEAD